MNLFKQAMYADKIKSREDKPIETKNRDIMCSIGITGVKAGAMAHGQAGQRWSKHKYLYIDSNGRYVYPEDAANNTKDKVSSAAKDLKTKLKDKKYKWDSKHKNKYNMHLSNYDKETDQILSAHKGATGEHYFDHYDPVNLRKNKQAAFTRKQKIASDKEELERRYAEGEKVRKRTKELENQKKKTEERKEEFLKERKKINQQANNAHSGYYEDKKKFPDGGSTEELENQKKKTKKRKRQKYLDTVNKNREGKRHTGMSMEYIKEKHYNSKKNRW